MNTYVDALITVSVRHTVELEDGETLEGFEERFADVYLHGAGENGHGSKEDLGGDTVIDVLNTWEN